MGWNVCWTKSRMVDVVFSRMVIMSNGARQQLSMWVAVQSTLAPHIQQVCGLQIGMARRRPTAIRTVSSSKWRPKDDVGRAFNQAPDSLQETASRRAREKEFEHSSRSDLAKLDTRGASQYSHCQHRVGGTGPAGPAAAGPIFLPNHAHFLFN